MVKLKSNSPRVTQSILWHRLYTLFNTTNFEEGLETRRALARDNKQARLKESYIDSYDPKTVSWETRAFPVSRMLHAFVEGCEVGTRDTSLVGVNLAIAVRLGHDGAVRRSTVKYIKKGSYFKLILDVSGYRSRVLSSLKGDKCLNASGALIEPLGVNSIKLEWLIQLSKEVESNP
jgi:hypothetical protein